MSFLLVRHPTRTACGFGFGMLVGVILRIGEAHGLISIEPVSQPEVIGTMLGGLLVHVPSLFRKRDLPENVETLFRAARRAVEEGGMTDVQRRMVYLRVVEAVIAEHAPAHSRTNTRAVRGPGAAGAGEAPQALASPEDGGL